MNFKVKIQGFIAKNYILVARNRGSRMAKSTPWGMEDAKPQPPAVDN